MIVEYLEEKSSNTSVKKRSLEDVLKYYGKVGRQTTWEGDVKFFGESLDSNTTLPTVVRRDNFEKTRKLEFYVPSKSGVSWNKTISAVRAVEVWPLFLKKIEVWYNTMYNPGGSNKTTKPAEQEKFPSWFTKLPDGPFGKIFADENRNEEDFIEPNTPTEDGLVNAIGDHLQGETKLSANEVVHVKDILAKGLYRDIFTPPSTKEVVRGMALTAAQFSKFIGLPLEKLNFVGSARPKKPLIYKPINGSSSSWTKDKKVAEKFSRTTTEGDRTLFVWLYLFAKTETNPNCFFDLQQWYKEVDNEFKSEKEIMGLGNIVIDKLEWKVYR